MNKYLFHIILIIITLSCSGVYAQINCITDPPLSPVLTSVSVDPENGNTLFTWNPSPSPNIAAYIIYSYKNGDGIALDTIRDPSATSYTLVSTVTKYLSVSYVVAAMRLPRCTSILSNSLSSVFEDASIDTCKKKILVSWNKYKSSPIQVTGYSVLVSVNGSSFSETAILSAADSSYTLSDFTIDANYCFVVRANLDGGKYSYSNKKCLSARMQRPPLWINANQATINGNGNVEVTFNIDPLSEITHFILERKSGSSSGYQLIAQPSSINGVVDYTDLTADAATVNLYRLSAVNSCNLPVLISNTASNLVLNLQEAGRSFNFSWNPYKSWLGKISSYKLFVDTGNGFEEKADISSSDSSYVFDYTQIMRDVTGKEVCFYISASEVSNPYGLTGLSISKHICTSPEEIITVPNLFTPDNDSKNDRFKPVLSFTPKEYHMIISDRRGRVLFETRDFLEEWDGSLNGDSQPEDVYLWYIKLITPSGKSISRTGTVTILHRN